MPTNDIDLPPHDMRFQRVRAVVSGRGERPAHVGFLLVPGFSLISYACAIEPFRAANRLSGETLYRWLHLTPNGKTATASNGVAIAPDARLSDVVDLDMLFVCAGGDPSLFADKPTFAWLRRQASRDVLIGGVSGGPFVLARAGLLSGYRCTIHWEHVDAFTEAFPNVALRRTLYESDRGRLTCSGGTAALDMMHELIKERHGVLLANAVSEWYLQTNIRSGDGPQRMAIGQRLGIHSERVLAAVDAMERNLEEPVSRRRLADAAGVSVRQLERLFQMHIGRTVGEYYRELRLLRARSLIHETALPVLEVGVASGFVSASHFSRSYAARFGLSPRADRARAKRPARRP